MRRRYILVILWLVIALFFTFLLIRGINKDLGPDMIFSLSPEKYGSKIPDDTKVFAASSIDSIDIQLSSSFVNVLRGTTGEVKVELYGSKNKSYKVDVVSNVLKITENHIPGFNPSLSRSGVIVYVPNDFDQKELDVALKSGTLYLEDVNFPKADLRTSSGSIRGKDCVFSSAETHSSSGGLHLENCRAEFLDSRVSSGKISISGSYDGFELKTSSGSINANLDKPLSRDSSASCSSGSVKIIMSQNSNCDIHYSCTSGSYKNNITGISGKNGQDLMGNGSVNLNLRTTSGSIRVYGYDRREYSINNSTENIAVENNYDFIPVSQEDLARAEAYFNDTTVYYTQEAKVYHSHEDCDLLKNEKEVIEGKVKDAFAANKKRLCAICAKKDGVTNEDLPVQGYLSNQTVIPTSADVRQPREVLDWYSSIGSIRTKTSDKTPATVVVEVLLGYKKDDKQAATEIQQRHEEIYDLLRRYFAKKKAIELLPKNEEKLQKELLKLINNVLKKSKIMNVKFKSLEVIEQ